MIELFGTPVLPATHHFLAFALAGLLLNLVPGPDMTFVVLSATRSGFRGGRQAALGIGAGSLVQIISAAAGISALIAASAAAYSVLRYAGAAYLLYLAFRNLRSSPLDKLEECPEARPREAIFRNGMLINLLNPKVIFFFLAFLPQFVDRNASVPAVQLVALGLWFNMVGTAVNIGVAFLTAGTSRLLARLESLRRLGKWVASAVLATFAFTLIRGADIR